MRFAGVGGRGCCHLLATAIAKLLHTLVGLRRGLGHILCISAAGVLA